VWVYEQDSNLLVSACLTTKEMSLPSMVVSKPGSFSLNLTTWLKKRVSVVILQSSQDDIGMEA
jgi:hypothetical protein